MVTVQQLIDRLFDVAADVPICFADFGALRTASEMSVHGTKLVINDGGPAKLHVSAFLKALDNIDDKTLTVCFVEMGALCKCSSVDISNEMIVLS
jgi:hypothetical protein